MLPIRTSYTWFFFFLFVLAGSAQAQSVEPPTGEPERILPENPTYDVDSRRAQKLADELKSPFCPGKTLKSCTSPNAARVRREIQDMVKQGLSNEEIIRQLKATHDRDDFSVTNPDQPAYTIFLPFLPFVILTVAMLMIIRRWQRGRPETPNARVEEAVDVNETSRAALRARLQAEDQDTEL